MSGELDNRSQMADDKSTLARKCGVVTNTRTVTDTGERQQMFGFTARHIKTTSVQEPSADACDHSHSRQESDGWYADLTPEFSCDEDVARAMNCLPPNAREAPQTALW